MQGTIARGVAGFAVAIGRAGAQLAREAARPLGLSALARPSLAACGDLLAPDRTLLLLAAEEEATAGELLALGEAAAHAGCQLGLLYGETAAQLADVVGRFVAYAPPERASDELLCWSQRELFRGAALRFIGPGSGASAAELAAMVSEAREAIFFCGHGGGFHVSVGAANFCRRPTPPAVVADHVSVPDCMRGGECALQRGGIPTLNLDTLRARRVVLLSCFGVTPGPWSTYDPRYSTGGSLIRNPHVEVALTSMRPMLLGPADLGLAYYLVASGIAFGEVALRLNRHRLARGLGPDIVCLGNPASRAARRVLEVRGQLRAGRVRVDATSLPAGAADVVLRGLEIAVKDPVLVAADDSGISSAVLDVDGSLYLTVEPGEARPARDLELRIESQRELAGEQLIGQLSRDLGELGWFIQHWTGGERTLPATRAIDVARELGERWPLERHMAHHLIPQSMIEQMSAALGDVLADVGHASLAAFAAGARAVAAPAATFEALYLYRSETRNHEPCPYCGNRIDLHRYERHSTGQLRLAAICQSCHWIWDGTARNAQRIETDAVVRPGATITATVRVDNPYDLAMRAYAIAIRDDLDLSRSQVGPVVEQVVPARGSAPITLQWEAPQARARSIMTMIAGVVIGGQLTALRRPAHVIPAGLLAREGERSPASCDPSRLATGSVG